MFCPTLGGDLADQMIRDSLPFICQQWHFALVNKSVMYQLKKILLVDHHVRPPACENTQKGKWSDHFSALITSIL